MRWRSEAGAVRAAAAGWDDHSGAERAQRRAGVGAMSEVAAVAASGAWPGLGPGVEARPAAAAARCVRSCCARLCSNVGLCALVAAYALLGAALFEALEAGFEAQQRGRAQRHRRDCLEELWDITVRMNVLYERNWTRLALARLRRFEREVAAAARLRGYDAGAGRQWTFSGALLYSVTVITTIGYGNLAPRTPEGKLLTMLYALVGVPLVLLCLSNLGALLAGAFQFAYTHWTRRGANASTAAAANAATDLLRRPSSPCVSPPSSPQHSISFSPEPSPLHPPPTHPALTRLLTPPSLPPPPPLSHARSPTPPLPPDALALLAECAAYNALHAPLEWDSPPRKCKGNGDADADCACCARDAKAKMDEAEEDEAANSATPRELRTPSRAPLLPSPAAAPAPAPPPPPPPPAPARVPAAAVLLVLAGYICAGAAAFAAWEEWSFLDGAYFCFITLSTIGFGDLVPGKSFERARSEGGHLQLVACCAYLLLGLVLIAMAFSLLQEEAVARLRRILQRLRSPSQR